MKAYSCKRWFVGTSTHSLRRYDALRDHVHRLTAHSVMYHVALEKQRKEKTTPFGVNLMRSQVLYCPDVLLLKYVEDDLIPSSQEANMPSMWVTPVVIGYFT